MNSLELAELPNAAPRDYRAALTVADLLVLCLLALEPFVNVLSPTTLLSPPMIAGFLLFLWLAFTGNFRLDGTCLTFIALCQISFLPWVLSGDYVSSKTLLHSLGLIASVLIFYAAARCGLSAYLTRRPAENVLRILYWGLLLSSLFIIVEFLGINGRIPDITPYIPYTQVNEFDALALGLVHRPRGFATEPGAMALFYDVALFAVIPLLSRGRSWRLGYYCVIVPAYLTLFSTASFVGTGLALSVLTAWNFRRRFLTTSGKIAMVIIPIAIAFVAGGSHVQKLLASSTTDRIATLIVGSGADSSANDRRSRLIEAENVAIHYPLGIGFGIAAGFPDNGGKYRGIDLSTGQVSMPGTFLVGGGIPAVVLWFAVTGFTVLRAVRIPRFGPYLAAGGAAIAIHQLTVTEFWLPYYWLFFALTNSFYRVPVSPQGTFRAISE